MPSISHCTTIGWFWWWLLVSRAAQAAGSAGQRAGARTGAGGAGVGGSAVAPAAVRAGETPPRACACPAACRPLPRQAPSSSAVNNKMHPHRGQGRLAGAVWAAAVISLVLPAVHALFGEFSPPLFSPSWPALLHGSRAVGLRRDASEVKGSGSCASRC
jgi:hypothetical protein